MLCLAICTILSNRNAYLGKEWLQLIEDIAKLPNIVTLDVGEYQGLLVDLMENFTITGVRCIVKIVGRYSLCTWLIYQANGFIF